MLGPHEAPERDVVHAPGVPGRVHAGSAAAPGAVDDDARGTEAAAMEPASGRLDAHADHHVIASQTAAVLQPQLAHAAAARGRLDLRRYEHLHALGPVQI